MSRAFISDPQWAGWEDIRHMRSTGVPWDKIAQGYKISKTRLCRYAKLNGIDTGGVAREDAVKIDWQDVQRQRMAGKSWAEIAKPYCIAGCTLSAKAEFQGLKMPLSKADAIAHMANPEWKGWAEIRKMREDGLSWEDIGSRLNVSCPTLRRMMVKAGVQFPAIKISSDFRKQMTLCWQCANSVPDKSGKRGCAWSRRFEPVKGWDAQETRLYGGDSSKRFQKSYCVRQCPEFVRG